MKTTQNILNGGKSMQAKGNIIIENHGVIHIAPFDRGPLVKGHIDNFSGK